MTRVQNIAIIGAGAAGLCAARHISSSKNFNVILFEGTNQIGGTWFYTTDVGKDKNGFPIHSSMYKNLVSNLPKQVMAFPDMPFASSLPSFLHHDDVLQYLEDYAKKFNLHQFIKLNTFVDEVSVVAGDEDKRFPKWRVKTYSRKTKTFDESIFDGVVVCNGHYSVPNIPNIEGKEKFKGRILHSHNYRDPDQFIDQHVVLFGGKSSGTDIAMHLHKAAKKVTLSHKGARFVAPFPDNVTQELPISRITEDGVEFVGGNYVECDAIMFCTGYNYYFPFFKDDSVIQISKNRVTPLYKHMLHIHYPNLSFIGICVLICPFPHFHCQVRVAAGVLDGSIVLPSIEKMLKHEENDFKERVANGYPVRGAHVMGDKQWKYNDDLADLSKHEKNPDNIRLLYNLCYQIRAVNLQHFKQCEFLLSDKGSYYLVNNDSSQNA